MPSGLGPPRSRRLQDGSDHAQAPGRGSGEIMDPEGAAIPVDAKDLPSILASSAVKLVRAIILAPSPSIRLLVWSVGIRADRMDGPIGRASGGRLAELAALLVAQAKLLRGARPCGATLRFE